MFTNELPTCPRCNQTDQVQKMSSLYGVNTKQWYEDSWRSDAKGQFHPHKVKHEEHTLLGLK